MRWCVLGFAFLRGVDVRVGVFVPGKGAAWVADPEGDELARDHFIRSAAAQGKVGADQAHKNAGREKRII